MRVSTATFQKVVLSKSVLFRQQTITELSEEGIPLAKVSPIEGGVSYHNVSGLTAFSFMLTDNKIRWRVKAYDTVGESDVVVDPRVTQAKLLVFPSALLESATAAFSGINLELAMQLYLYTVSNNGSSPISLFKAITSWLGDRVEGADSLIEVDCKALADVVMLVDSDDADITTRAVAQLQGKPTALVVRESTPSIVAESKSSFSLPAAGLMPPPKPSTPPPPRLSVTEAMARSVPPLNLAAIALAHVDEGAVPPPPPAPRSREVELPNDVDDVAVDVVALEVEARHVEAVLPAEDRPKSPDAKPVRKRPSQVSQPPPLTGDSPGVRAAVEAPVAQQARATSMTPSAERKEDAMVVHKPVSPKSEPPNSTRGWWLLGAAGFALVAAAMARDRSATRSAASSLRP